MQHYGRCKTVKKITKMFCRMKKFCTFVVLHCLEYLHGVSTSFLVKYCRVGRYLSLSGWYSDGVATSHPVFLFIKCYTNEKELFSTNPTTSYLYGGTFRNLPINEHGAPGTKAKAEKAKAGTSMPFGSHGNATSAFNAAWPALGYQNPTPSRNNLISCFLAGLKPYCHVCK